MTERKQLKPEAPKATSKKTESKDNKTAMSTARKTGSYKFFSDRNIKKHVVGVAW
jgi:hypothetical protein